jgi:hypothetical protein
MTITEMKEAFTTVQNAYILALDRYTDEQFGAQPSEMEWSLGQMYEHLYGANIYFFLANVTRCLERRKGQEGGEMTDTGRSIFSYNSFPPIKIKVPEAVKGPEPVARDRAAYRILFSESLMKGLALADALAQSESNYKTLHPVFGYLNAWEWFQACEIHARHHLRQQQEREEWLGLSRT